MAVILLSPRSSTGINSHGMISGYRAGAASALPSWSVLRRRPLDRSAVDTPVKVASRGRPFRCRRLLEQQHVPIRWHLEKDSDCARNHGRTFEHLSYHWRNLEECALVLFYHLLWRVLECE